PAGLAANISQRNVLRYAGYCYDEVSGLYYLSQRYYDPATACFVSKDPARADGEESAYQYCAGIALVAVGGIALLGVTAYVLWLYTNNRAFRASMEGAVRQIGRGVRKNVAISSVMALSVIRIRRCGGTGTKASWSALKTAVSAMAGRMAAKANKRSGKSGLSDVERKAGLKLVATGSAILGTGHNPKNKGEWDKWWKKRSKAQRKLYDRLSGPHPRVKR
ncbi:MAG: RHS repeat-associated core domain-containing protein, partial [Actinomycetota bacterium]|nr:RHS repeat-associated core domain-containing protein [Actinomycetota bacterium]